MNRISLATLAAACAVLFSSPALAQSSCVGTGAYRTCTDPSTGNNYTINRQGNSTYLQGYNSQTGSSWNQATNRIGSSSFTTGTASDGSSWNATTTRSGNSSFTSGLDSQGRSFSSTTNRIGDTTITTSMDGAGNMRTRTCNKYGCY